MGFSSGVSPFRKPELAIWVGGVWSFLGDPKACEGFLPQGGLVTRLSSSWAPVEGSQDVCSCCEMRSCGLARHSRRPYAPSQWQGGRARRELPSQLGMSRCASWVFVTIMVTCSEPGDWSCLATSWLLGANLRLGRARWPNEFECSNVFPFRSLGERSRCCGWTSLHPQLAGSPS